MCLTFPNGALTAGEEGGFPYVFFNFTTIKKTTCEEETSRGDRVAMMRSARAGQSAHGAPLVVRYCFTNRETLLGRENILHAVPWDTRARNCGLELFLAFVQVLERL